MIVVCTEVMVVEVLALFPEFLGVYSAEYEPAFFAFLRCFSHYYFSRLKLGLI
jgi:hypothetical protein